MVKLTGFYSVDGARDETPINSINLSRHVRGKSFLFDLNTWEFHNIFSHLIGSNEIL